MEESLIIAMTVAAIAEEYGVNTNHVLVRSFKEVQKTSLERFIEDNNISYHKYQLGE